MTKDSQKCRMAPCPPQTQHHPQFFCTIIILVTHNHMCPQRSIFNRTVESAMLFPFCGGQYKEHFLLVPKRRLSLQIWACALCVEDKVSGFSLDHFTPGTKKPPQIDAEDRKVQGNPDKLPHKAAILKAAMSTEC